MSVNSEVPSIHLALQHALLGKTSKYATTQYTTVHMKQLHRILVTLKHHLCNLTEDIILYMILNIFLLKGT